jgi:hypothetical protein
VVRYIAVDIVNVPKAVGMLSVHLKGSLAIATRQREQSLCTGFW